MHTVLEQLYDLPASERTVSAALGMLPDQWEEHRGRNPQVIELFDSPGRVGAWLEKARGLIASYFRLENPARLEPAERELFVQAQTRGGLLLHGYQRTTNTPWLVIPAMRKDLVLINSVSPKCPSESR